MEDDYIFVEGNRYISAKKAAEITGYTSDYIGQIAREGKVRSKKIGRIRFVEEGELKEYTIESDRKKNAINKLSKINVESTPKESPVIAPVGIAEGVLEVAVDGESQEVEPEKVQEQEVPSEEVNPTPTESDARVEEDLPDEDQQKEQEEQEEVEEKIPNTQEELVHVSVQDIEKPWDISVVTSKAGALLVALMIVFGPYIARETGAWAYIKDVSSVAYESFIFETENVAMALYQKTDSDGWFNTVFDSLQHTEMAARDAIATSFYGYMKAGEFLRNAPKEFAKRNTDKNIGDYMIGAVQSAFKSIKEDISN
ncbi:hypothetical protein COW81_02235 [Candidatus Campbellbacteria bacterium CG22_combo_CG10-13_8_21_14_all_36_13]|uniref:Helix-turn-helix domain-containing protein n=1 Tax=Candidatus Campbellbacteria bacterium CG22_combo_CG10-13_8_21_14_all_36_13 TaxID=1974529 RepID=A0A2H0DY36_9BACT|nr:MAG: hypothetical protein COW81_02235 [Candidatus Campbellbacteria bacterium CG22_combo_CG10-13_8_21_14_all_36_13]